MSIEQNKETCPDCKGDTGFFCNITCSHQEWVVCETCNGKGMVESKAAIQSAARGEVS